MALRCCRFWISLCVLALLCRSQAIPTCEVEPLENQTAYIISGLPHASVNASYSWANASGHMLAHNTEAIPKLVLKSSIKTLITSKCLKTIVYCVTLYPEGEFLTAKCRASCTENAWTQGHKGWFALVALVFVVVLGLVLCYKFQLFTRCRQGGL